MFSSQAKPEQRSKGTEQSKRVQLDWPADKDFRILSIDGGGIKGVFPAAFLSELEEKYLNGESIAKHFDLITGTSTGGIIALGLSAGFTAKELLEFYRYKGPVIFPRWRYLLSKILSVGFYSYDEKVLKSALEQRLGDALLGHARNRLCIPAFEGGYGEVFVYKTNHHPRYEKDHLTKMVTAGLGTSAAPTFFKPHANDGYTMVDGGVWANNPIMIGLVDALACYNVSRDKIKILSIGCGVKPYKVSLLKRFPGGQFFWRDIIYAAMNLQSQNAIGQAGLLIGRNNIIRVEPSAKAEKISLDDYKRAFEVLPIEAKEKLDEYGEDIAKIYLQEAVEIYKKFHVV